MSVLEIAQQTSVLTQSDSLPGNVEKVGLGGDKAAFTSAAESLPVTQTERANYDFYCQVKQIYGARVSVYGGETWSEKNIVVVVPDVFDATADAVLDLKTQIHQTYPAARLHVRVTEVCDDACEEVSPSVSAQV